MINPQKFSKEQMLTKWGALIEKVTELKKPEDIQKVCEFSHFYALDEYMCAPGHSTATCIGPYAGVGMFKAPQALAAIAAMENSGPPRSMLPLNLNIIKQIIDLSNVVFIHAPTHEEVRMVTEIDSDGTTCLRRATKFIRVDDIKNKIKAEKDLIHDVFPPSMMVEEIEKIAAETVANQINTILSKGHKLYIYKPVEYIKSKNTVDDDYIEYVICSRWFEDVEKTVSLGDL